MDYSQITYHVLVNPSAGRGRTRRQIPEIQNFFQEREVTFHLTVLDSKEHAYAIIREILLQINREKSCQRSVLVGAGGDGTCNEMINGVMRCLEVDDSLQPPFFGFIPLGSGNDFATGAGLPTRAKLALETLLNGTPRPMDVGILQLKTVREKFYFANGMGAGFDTLIALEAESLKKRWKGMSYWVATLKLLIAFPDCLSVTLECDGKQTQLPITLISIMNGKTMGGGFKTAPQASMDDGRLNLCSTFAESRRQVISALFSYVRGTQIGRKDTTTFTGESFKVKAQKGSFPIHADGEILSTNESEFTVSCLKHRIELIRSS